MSGFFTRERFGTPQFLGALLLLAFLAQAVWLAHVQVRQGATASSEEVRIQHGLEQFRHGTPAGAPFADGAYDSFHSPFWYLASSAPLLFWPGQLDSYSYWGMLARVPFLIFGLLLGASLWYVARRLYGNAGGYIALTLYCFSPGILRAAALAGAGPEIGAAWGAYGAVFTAIAVAHTLYAPREVILWNWRRILLLGISIALAVGTQFSLVTLLPVILAFMLYLAPERRGATFVIWIAGCAIGFILLCASYFFHPAAILESFRHARFLDFSLAALKESDHYSRLLWIFAACPALLPALPVALTLWILWRRARYFGNTAPRLVAFLCLIMALGQPHYPGSGFLLVALPFLFTFVAGICADLLETRQQTLIRYIIISLLGSYAGWNVVALARL